MKITEPYELRFQDDFSKSVEIFYCSFCGRKLNNWNWANERRAENFK